MVYVKYKPSTSRFIARYWRATTPGSLGTKSNEPLLAFAWATDETPIYMTNELIKERL